MTIPFLPYVLKRLVAHTVAGWRMERARRQLEAMSDSELRDLGIGRSQISDLTKLK